MTDNRRKGKDGENEAARLWRRWFPNARRSFGQARRGYEQPDILHCKPFYIEVKRCATEPTKNKLKKWWNKLIEDWVKFEKLNGDHDTWEPVLVWRVDCGRWQIGMYGTLANQLSSLADVEDDVWYTTTWESFARSMDEIYPIHNGGSG